MKFSIIIPVYNSEATIERCVNSIRTESYSDFEIILIDDGSSDNSLRICESLAYKDNRIIVFHQPNKGAAAARNKGIRNSTGDYLCFIDSDDTVTNDFLSVINKYCEKYTPDIVWFNMRCVDENDEELFCSHHISPSIQISQKEYLSSFFGMNVNIGSMWSKAYRRIFIEENMDHLLDEDIIYGEDWEFNLRCGFHNPKIVLANETLYNYKKYTSHNTVTTRYYARNLETFCNSYLKLLDVASEYNIVISVKEQNSLFVYNVISLLDKLFRSPLMRKERNKEFKRILSQSTFNKVLHTGLWDNRYMSKRQYCIAIFLRYRLEKLAKLALKA